MCYKILKAIRICKEGHVLKVRACWRQCKFLVARDDLDGFARCNNVVATSSVIRIDYLHGTRMTEPAQCLLCTPVPDNAYKEKKLKLEKENEELATIAERLVESQAFARRENQSQGSKDLIAHWEPRYTARRERVQIARDDLEWEGQRIQTQARASVQADLRTAENALKPNDPIFYYGPTTGADRSLSSLNAPRDQRLEKRAIPASAAAEYIIDWSEPANGRKKIVLY